MAFTNAEKQQRYRDRIVLTIRHKGGDDWSMSSDMHPVALRALLVSLIETLPTECEECHGHA